MPRPFRITRIDALLLDATDPQSTAAFYRDKLGIPLEAQRHGGDPHFECDLGDVHFAIHRADERSAAFSLAVSDLDAAVDSLRRAGVEIELEPEQRPYGRLAAVRDPEANLIYLHE